MNTTDNSWHNANASHASTDDETSPDKARYILTIEEASRLFAESGVPRSPRTITRFCQLGDLDCIRVETERNFKYLIDPSSVEKRITQLQQALHFSSKTSPDTSSYVETNSETQLDMPRHDEQERETPGRNEEVDYLRNRVEELENENVHLKISRQASELVINQMNAERKEFISQLNNMNFQLGEAQAKLQLLDAPRQPDEARHVETKLAEPVSDAVEVPSEPGPAPEAALPPQPAAPATEPAPAKQSFLGRLFGR